MKMSRTWVLEREVYSVECRMGKNMTSSSGRKYLGVQLGTDAQLRVSGNGTLLLKIINQKIATPNSPFTVIKCGVSLDLAHIRWGSENKWGLMICLEWESRIHRRLSAEIRLF